MLKIILIVVGVIAVLGLFISGVTLWGYNFKLNGSKGNSGQTNGQAIDYSNYTFEQYVSAQPMINELPDNAVLLLKFYNFNSGERQWDKSYVIKKGSFKESDGSDANPDAEITIASKYKDEIKSGFCDTMMKAKQNGDMGMELKISKISFLWKYNSVMKYKSCFGL